MNQHQKNLLWLSLIATSLIALMASLAFAQAPAKAGKPSKYNTHVYEAEAQGEKEIFKDSVAQIQDDGDDHRIFFKQKRGPYVLSGQLSTAAKDIALLRESQKKQTSISIEADKESKQISKVEGSKKPEAP